MPKAKKLTEKEREKLVKEATKLVEEMGKQALYEARKQVLQDIRKLKSKQLKGAIRHMIKKRWKDYSRPALMMMVCEAVGGDPELTKEIAKALILIAAAIDLHDDIIDKSTTKRGEPTTLGLYDPEISLIAGDIFYVEGFTQLVTALAKNVITQKIAEAIKWRLLELGDAEALEREFVKAGRIPSSQKYLRLVHKKSADAELYFLIPAITAHSPSKLLNSLKKTGRLLGEIMILFDDLEDFANRQELEHRLKNEIPPLPIIYITDSIPKDFRLEEVIHYTKDKGGEFFARRILTKKLKKLQTLFEAEISSRKLSTVFQALSLAAM